MPAAAPPPAARNAALGVRPAPRPAGPCSRDPHRAPVGSCPIFRVCLPPATSPEPRGFVGPLELAGSGGCGWGRKRGAEPGAARRGAERGDPKTSRARSATPGSQQPPNPFPSAGDLHSVVAAQQLTAAPRRAQRGWLGSGPPPLRAAPGSWWAPAAGGAAGGAGPWSCWRPAPLHAWFCCVRERWW